MTAQHVPAWKRLGLKLKFANENASNAATDLDSGNHGKKRKQAIVPDATDGLQHQHQLKKTRVNGDLLGSRLSKAEQESQNGTLLSNKSDSPRRKKSVSFTSDTKVEDGDSAQTIQTWVPDSPGSTPNKTSNELDSIQPQILVKRPKREKKPKDDRDASSVQPRKATAALDYLNQFYKYRSSWKFNKNHESWILRHALSIEVVPSQYNLALATYLRGLKSVGARKRLVEQSREALNKGGTLEGSSEDLQSKFSQAVALDGDEFDAKQQHEWIEGLDRNKLILLSLEEDLQLVERETSIANKQVPRTKKNKSRTSRIEIDSSSSSDSEGDDDTSDSSIQKPTSLSRTSVSGRNDAESTSSSGSSDESSSETSQGSKTESDTDSE